MKKVIIFLAVMVLAFSLNVGANHKPKNDLNKECQDFGFTFGVAEWKWEKKMWWEWNKKEWNPNGDEWDTSVTGTHNEANWDVGTLDDFGTTGIVVKSGKDHYSKSGSTGTVTGDKNIEHITFCLKLAPCTSTIQCPPGFAPGCIVPS